ncbi:putative sucrose-phosphate synthase 1 [Camellia lanceoleosa]|uniref:Sucrose-phosphate synthase 1 n=1 Tax=Camellia lanceoleosa TaxID=1840588 RepID=A0ACC0I7T0_9ERIC|nr:putative sucrose-phosphate synthase 1 [Camellia lanceoleosa]
MKVRLNNNQRKKIPKLQLIDESSSSTGPYGGPCTQHSDAQVDIQSPFTAIAGKKRKANQKLPTKTKLHLDESDSSLDTKEDKFDQSLNLLGKLLGLNFEASATAIEVITNFIIVLDLQSPYFNALEDIVVMELFYTPVEFATRFDLCSLQPKTWICGSVKYVVELTRALGSMPGVYRVDLLTRQVSSPEVDWSYGEPTEKEAKLHTKGK